MIYDDDERAPLRVMSYDEAPSRPLDLKQIFRDLRPSAPADTSVFRSLVFSDEKIDAFPDEERDVDKTEKDKDPEPADAELPRPSGAKLFADS